MDSLPFYWIDVFTRKKLVGNPCAVVLNAGSLSASQMQAIAKEINLSETAFVRSSKLADFGARYFTPDEELPFAGHPTVATIHALVESGLLKLKNGVTEVNLEVPAGVIPIQIVQSENSKKITMSQLAPKFLKTYDRMAILQIYGLSPQDLVPNVPIQTVSTGSPILMIPLATHEALKRVKYVDIKSYEELKAQGDFLFPHHFCVYGATSRGATFARSLGIPPNGLEDPFTGSATGCMAAYLWKYGILSNLKFIAEQGHWMGRPGEAEVEIVGSANNIQTVRLTGEAVTVIEGKIDISDL